MGPKPCTVCNLGGQLGQALVRSAISAADGHCKSNSNRYCDFLGIAIAIFHCDLRNFRMLWRHMRFAILRRCGRPPPHDPASQRGWQSLADGRAPLTVERRPCQHEVSMAHALPKFLQPIDNDLRLA